MFNNYDVSKYNPSISILPPIGKHRIKVQDAELQTSKSSGNKMVKVTFSVSGYSGKIFHYFVDNEYFQRNIDPFFDSFGIMPGEFDLRAWLGKAGAATIKHEDFNGSPQAKIGYFILRENQNDLPEWGERSEGEKSSSTGSSSDGDFPDDFPMDMELDFDSLPSANSEDVDTPF